jgi:hypothetical protein
VFLTKDVKFMVYVLNENNVPLMPCENVIARLLMKEGKAKCVSRLPFVVKLTTLATSTHTQGITLGIDSGSGTVGSAAVTDDGKVLYMAQIEIRNDVTKKMTQRSMYRRNRRNRKTRYRKPRWSNRANSNRKDRFSPTMVSKIASHKKEIAFVRSILPITNVIIETGTFDPHALKNPEVLQNKTLYAKGINYGFANTKAYVLDRDGHTCQHCKGKSKDKRLEVHHIVFRSSGGSDEESNLVTLCKKDHDAVHKGLLVLKLKGKKKSALKHATQMNSIRIQLLKSLPDAVETFGYITKEHRQSLNIPKEHYFDAVVIASSGHEVTYSNADVLLKKCVPKGDYQQYKGKRSQQKIPTGKICGFRKWDKVKYFGKDYFIKGRMSSGYALLMGIDGEPVSFQHIPKFPLLHRISARTSWLVSKISISHLWS